MKKIFIFLSIFVPMFLLFSFGFYSHTVFAVQEECTHAKELYEFTRTKKKSTCIFQGLGVYTCPSCGKEETRRMPYTEHVQGEWKVKTDSTCSRTGTEECFCSVCDAVCGIREIEKKPHSFGEWGITTKPTCCVEGVQKRICEYCGLRESKTVLPTGVHVFGEYELTQLSSCSTAGQKTRTCMTCEESIDLALAMDAEEHTFSEGEILIKNSCLFEGKIRYVCTDCGETKEQIIPARGHTLTSVEKNTVVCACGYSETKVKKFGKSQQTFVCGKATLIYKTKEITNGEYAFDFCKMTDVLAEEYRQYYPNFYEAYLFRLEFAGKASELTGEMQLSIALDEELKDHHLKIAVLRAGKFYYLDHFEIKDGKILIDGEYLSGAEAIFLEKGERITMSIAVPIVVTVVTLIAATSAVLFLVSRKKAYGYM